MIVTALEDFNHRRRMADLIKHAGTCAGFMSADEVKNATPQRLIIDSRRDP
jgi:hypothetical protein